jgi:hypothetical protein
MDSNKYLNDISEIKSLMNKSTRFLSLSGLSGVLAGIYALIGAGFAHTIIYASEAPSNESYKTIELYETDMLMLFAIAFLVLLLSLFTGIFFSYKKARKNGENIWDKTSKRLLINFLIPLATGGFFLIFLIEKDIYVFVAPLTLIFYGLACVNASHYTLGYTRSLGITMLLIGLLSVWFLGYGLYFWALGFGLMHIIYGTLMYFKYD